MSLIHWRCDGEPCIVPRMKYPAIAGLMLLAACGKDVTAPELGAWQFEGLQPYATYKDPTPLRTLWSKVEACSGLKGDFDSASFYSAASITRAGKQYGGAWVLEGNRIILAQGIFAPENEALLIMHEEMHALLQSGTHPASYFNGACGDLMTYSAH